MAEDDTNVMTDADFEKALDALREDDSSGEVNELLKIMNENRMISWEEAEQILGGSSNNNPIKSSLPEQTRPSEPDNDTDVEQSIQRLLQNDTKLKQINLNNMKRTPIPQVQRLISAIRNNTNLEKLSLANMGLYDGNVEPLIDVLENNSTLKSINLETNYLSGDFFARLFQSALKQQSLEEVKAVNQGVTFATASEKQIIDSIFENHGLIKVSINLRLPEARHKVENAMLRNGEIKRILRRRAAAQAQEQMTPSGDTAKNNMATEKPKVASTTKKPAKQPTKSNTEKLSQNSVKSQAPTNDTKSARSEADKVKNSKEKPSTDAAKSEDEKAEIAKDSTTSSKSVVDKKGSGRVVDDLGISKTEKKSRAKMTTAKNKEVEAVTKPTMSQEPENTGIAKKSIEMVENAEEGNKASAKPKVPAKPGKKPMQVYPLKKN